MLQEAWEKFNDIEKLLPDYKSTRGYIERIKQTPGIKLTPPKPHVLPPTPGLVEVSLESQQKQAQEIAFLAEKSAQLYRQMADIADDRSTVQMKRKMARVREMLKSLMEKKEHLLGQMREEQWKRQQEALKVKQEQGRAEAEKMYQVKQEHLKQLEVKESAEGKLRLRKQQEALDELAGKASDINDDIIFLSKQQDYEAMKAKFAELENTVTALMAVKQQMSQQKDHQEREKDLARESVHQRNEMLSFQKQEEQKIRAYHKEEPLKEYHPAAQPNEAQKYQIREIKQEQDMLFNQGVGFYKQKNYTQAKILFAQLADRHDRRGEAWLKKVDRALTQQLLRNEEQKAKERTAFIADQLRAQRELAVIQERERQRQKKLTEEIERQKRRYEDDRLLQLRKEETLKAQERERELQEQKRLRMQEENGKREEAFRFHKIETAAQPQPQAGPGAVAMPAKQLQAQPELEKKPKEEALRQAQLEARRAVVRKQLEEGVEAMYQDALKAYQQGRFTLAADRFKDVEDIFPGYKRAGIYMHEARLKSLAVNPQAVIIPETSQAPASPSVSRQETISKTLDLFDSNVK